MGKQKKKQKKTDVRTHRALMDLLKKEGPQDAGTLSKRLGVTAMAVRQHLYEMDEEGFVTYEEEPRPMGRPVKKWRLTAKADKYFPDRHDTLTVSLIDSVRKAFGEEGMEKLVAVRSARQIVEYQKVMPKRAPLVRRIRKLAELRSEEGYMAEVEKQRDGVYLLIENHCPICTAATACQGLCAGELEVFRKVLGNDVSVQRTDHIQAGARRCAYLVRED